MRFGGTYTVQRERERKEASELFVFAPNTNTTACVDRRWYTTFDIFDRNYVHTRKLPEKGREIEPSYVQLRAAREENYTIASLRVHLCGGVSTYRHAPHPTSCKRPASVLSHHVATHRPFPATEGIAVMTTVHR